MKKLLIIAGLVTSMGAIAGATDSKFKLIHANDLSNMLETDKAHVKAVDANNAKTRAQFGIIPGAIVLSSYDKFAEAELPKDHSTKLVFYCANTACSASHDAADKALTIGYTDVSVMADGIQGWKEAGKPTAKVSKN